MDKKKHTIRFGASICGACWKCTDKCSNKVICKVNIIIHKYAILKYIDRYTGCLKCAHIYEFKALSTIKQLIMKISFNSRSLISIGLFINILCLVITALLIQIFETLENEFPMHFFTATHATCGICFMIFSVFHLSKNWLPMKKHLMKSPKGYIGKEVMVALILLVFIVTIGFVLTYSFF